ncbi:MAG: hypothetical protein NHB15_05900 [Methanosarcina barkeri]|nr:hypothetical protein [Methanosarcina sp. ERenArc_MAG2]
MKIKEKYKLRKSSGPYINHVDKENLDAFVMSFGGATALNLTHASDLEPIRKVLLPTVTFTIDNMYNRKECRYYRPLVTFQHALMTFRIGS